MEKSILLQVELPIRIKSAANIPEHWAKKRKWINSHRLAVKIALLSHDDFEKIQLPVTIELVRIAPRSLDDDNLAYAFKHIRDQITACFKPDLAAGRGDEGTDIIFRYSQQKSSKIYSFRICIYDAR